MSDYQYSTLLGTVWVAISFVADGFWSVLAATIAIFLFATSWLQGVRVWWSERHSKTYKING